MKNIFTILILGIILGAGGMYFFSKEASTPSTEDNSLVYAWQGIDFEYPGDWILEEVKYQTPAMQDTGMPGDIVGFNLKSSNASDAGIISIGGRQVECKAVSVLPCAKVGANKIPLLLEKDSSEARNVFGAMISKLRNQGISVEVLE